MIDLIKTALVGVVRESIGIDLVEDKITVDGCLISKITLDSHVFYVVSNNDLLLEFSTCLLCEPDPDFNILVDMANEIANLVIGRTKVLCEEKGMLMHLGIPEFIENSDFKYSDSIGFSFASMRCGVFQA